MSPHGSGPSQRDPAAPSGTPAASSSHLEPAQAAAQASPVPLEAPMAADSAQRPLPVTRLEPADRPAPASLTQPEDPVHPLLAPTPTSAPLPPPAPAQPSPPLEPFHRPQVGSVLGRFRLLEKLGEGGMATVYKAEMGGEGGFTKRVALKLFHPHLAANPLLQRWFISEARLGGLLHHPNLVEILDFGRHDHWPFLAMELVEGPTLEQLIQGHRLHGVAIPLEVTLQILIQVCHGLEYAHQARDHQGQLLGLVHRDLKPSNLLLSRHGLVKIGDFGVARATSNLEQTRATGAIRGTFCYMSPEQARGRRSLDHRSDLFALGLILYELLTLHPLYDEDLFEELLWSVGEAAVGPRLDALPPMPAQGELVSILRVALAKEPADRFQSARDVRLTLESLLARLPRPKDLADWLLHRATLREPQGDELRSSPTARTDDPESLFEAPVDLPPLSTSPKRPQIAQLAPEPPPAAPAPNAETTLEDPSPVPVLPSPPGLDASPPPAWPRTQRLEEAILPPSRPVKRPPRPAQSLAFLSQAASLAQTRLEEGPLTPEPRGALLPDASPSGGASHASGPPSAAARVSQPGRVSHTELFANTGEPAPTFDELEIHVLRRGLEGYPVYIRSARFGEADGISRLRPEDEAVEDLTLLLRSGQLERGQLEQYGGLLLSGPPDCGFAGLLSGRPLEHFRYILGAVEADPGRSLVLRLRLEAPELAALPWEYLFDPVRRVFLATDRRCLLVRTFSAPRPLPPLHAQLPLRGLFIAPDAPELSAAAELSALRSSGAGAVQWEALTGRVTLETIQARLHEAAFHVLHFSGHGLFDAQGKLLLSGQAPPDAMPVPGPVGDSAGQSKDFILNSNSYHQSSQVPTPSTGHEASQTGSPPPHLETTHASERKDAPSAPADIQPQATACPPDPMGARGETAARGASTPGAPSAIAAQSVAGGAAEETQPRETLTEETLADLLLAYPTFRLVVINACQAGRLDPAAHFGGMAQRLLYRDVPAVVVMQQPIPDRAALRFASTLYRSLFVGSRAGHIPTAVNQARAELLVSGGHSLGAPVLYLRSREGQLFDLEREERASLPARQAWDEAAARFPTGFRPAPGEPLEAQHPDHPRLSTAGAVSGAGQAVVPSDRPDPGTRPTGEPSGSSGMQGVGGREAIGGSRLTDLKGSGPPGTLTSGSGVGMASLEADSRPRDASETWEPTRQTRDGAGPPEGAGVTEGVSPGPVGGQAARQVVSRVGALQRLSRGRLRQVLAGILFVGMALGLRYVGVMEPLDVRRRELVDRYVLAPAYHPDVVGVDLSDAVEPWPWRRATLVKLLEVLLTQSQARAVVLDVRLTEGARPDEDVAAFEAANARLKAAVASARQGPAAKSVSLAWEAALQPPVGPEGLIEARAWEPPAHWEGLPFAFADTQAPGKAGVVVRQLPLVIGIREKPGAFLHALSAGALAGGQGPIVDTSSRRVRLGDRWLQTDHWLRCDIPYTEERFPPRVSGGIFLGDDGGGAALEGLKGKVVVVGRQEDVQLDRVATPWGYRPGVRIHEAMLADLLNGRCRHQGPWLWQTLVQGLTLAGVLWFIARRRPWARLGWAMGALLAAQVLELACVGILMVWLSFPVPELALVCVLLLWQAVAGGVRQAERFGRNAQTWV